MLKIQIQHFKMILKSHSKLNEQKQNIEDLSIPSLSTRYPLIQKSFILYNAPLRLNRNRLRDHLRQYYYDITDTSENLSPPVGPAKNTKSLHSFIKHFSVECE